MTTRIYFNKKSLISYKFFSFILIFSLKILLIAMFANVDLPYNIRKLLTNVDGRCCNFIG